MNGIG
ncbi:Protein of unknown function [Bacillus cytotoxicus]